MDKVFQLYDKFLSLFPDNWHTAVSIIVLAIMVMLVIRYFKYGVIGIILLILFVPASVPVLRQIGLAILAFAQHVLGTK